MNLNFARPIAFIDLETTGVDVATDRIVEIAIIKLFPDDSMEKYEFRVNPTIPIPKSSSLIHGIYDADVAHEQTFEEQSKKLFKILFDCDLAGYNSNKFDIPLLAEEFLRVGIDFDISEKNMIDVQNIFHKLERRTLAAGYRFYTGKVLNNAHNAMADTEATLEIFRAQMDRYLGKTLEDDQGNEMIPFDNDITSIHEFSKAQNCVDLMGRIVYNEAGEEVFNFGKYKGRSVVDVFKKDPGYYSWMMNGDFPMYTKKVLKQLKEKMLR